MIDVHLPTIDGREIVMARHTQPEQDPITSQSAKSG